MDKSIFPFLSNQRNLPVQGCASVADLPYCSPSDGALVYVGDEDDGGLFELAQGEVSDDSNIFNLNSNPQYQWKRIVYSGNVPKVLSNTSEFASEKAWLGKVVLVSNPSSGGVFRSVNSGTADGVTVFNALNSGWTFQKISSNLTDLQSQVDKAQEWAENPEDTPVETGQFSALHHAAKAADSATSASAAQTAAEAAQDAAETASLAAGAYPDTTAGLAATSNGEYFWAASGGILTLYLNSTGTAVSQSITLLAGDAFNTLWIPAIQMSELFNDGATFSIATNRLPVWLLDPDTVSYLGFPIRFPAHWTAFTCDFIYVNTTASSGDVSLGVNIDEWAIGETINTSPSGASITDTPSSTAWISNIATISGSINVDPTKYCSVRISRNATSGADTLTNDIGLIGVNLRKA